MVFYIKKKHYCAQARGGQPSGSRYDDGSFLFAALITLQSCEPFSKDALAMNNIDSSDTKLISLRCPCG